MLGQILDDVFLEAFFGGVGEWHMGLVKW
jgi:hypothetical protein